MNQLKLMIDKEVVMKIITKLVYGIGVNDADYYVLATENFNGKRKITWRCPYHLVWSNMLKRVYNPTYQLNNQTYRDVKVCEGWLTFSNFKSWMGEQDYEGKELDKDLLGDGKMYSPETCCFLPRSLNLFLTKNDARRGNYPLGVSRRARNKSFESSCADPFLKKSIHLGSYKTPEEAHATWKSYKHKLACAYAEQQDDSRIAHALRNRFI